MPNWELPPQVRQSLLDCYATLDENGRLLSAAQLSEYYALFRERFGPSKLARLDGEILLNTIHGRGENNSLVYWLEFKDDAEFPNYSFGSIKGGNSLKFGVYKTKDTGEWMTGHNLNPRKISVEEAVKIVRSQRDQLVAAATAVQNLPDDADEKAYFSLQNTLSQVAPDICDVAWGHKYLYLLFPAKLDDYHVYAYQRHHLIKLLQLPVAVGGLFANAGQFVRVAKHFGWPMNHLAAVLNKRDGSPIKYWRIGTKLGEAASAQDIWPDMRDGGYAAIGWAELGDLSVLAKNEDARDKLNALFGIEYKYPANVASRKAGEVKNFAKDISINDVILAAEGERIRGVGVVKGAYRFESTNPEDAPHRREVEWHNCPDWKLPLAEGVRTTVYNVKDDIQSLIEAEKYLLEPAMNARSANSLSTTTSEAPEDAKTVGPKKLPFALNTILYGPPGTGKTYRLRNDYMEKYFTDRKAMPTAEERAADFAKDLSWWEVIALTLLDAKQNRGTVAEILAHPLVTARVRLSSNNNPRAMIWASLQIHTKAECPNVKYSSRSEPLLFEKDASSVWSIDPALADKEMPELRNLLNRFLHPEDAAATVTRRYRFTTFHQSFSYEDFIEGIKPQLDAAGDGQNDQISYEIKPGVFKEICVEANANPTKNYAIFIDEINRGNVASIFGELISLIEDDKRLGKPNQLTATLPYSRKEFGVPCNLYIIGTMNTADRSVEALDTALRRRFTFEEMRPDVRMIPSSPELPVNLQKLFEVINARIEQLLDHDHCIGHAYFMEIRNLADLKKVFANKIIPLLREYFYGHPAKIGMVLGERFVSCQRDQIAFATGPWGMEDMDKKPVYEFADVFELKLEDFAAIYA